MKRSDAVFFLSGAAALIDQVAWARLAARLLGGDALGTAVVLAVFMLGLGLGAPLGARALRRVQDARRLYLALGLFTGAWAAASPLFFAALEPVAGLAPRFVVAFAALLAPTLAMGAGFPVMAQLVLRERSSLGAVTGGVYGANTLGAAAGALAAPFLFLPWLGLAGSLAAAGALDAVAGLLALTLAAPLALRGTASPPSHPGPGPDSPSSTERPPGRPGNSGSRAHSLLFVTALLGFASLALEVLVTRLLIAATGASVYAFAIVLCVFLTGLGLGGRQAGEWLARGAEPRRLLARAAAWIPALTLAGVLALAWRLGEADPFGPLSNRMPSGASPLRLWLGHALFAALALLPLAVAFGAALPAAAAVLDRERPGARAVDALGALYLWNTVGAAAGALAAAFLLLPNLGPRGALVAALAPCLVASRLAAPRAFAPGLFVALVLGALTLRGGPPPADVRLHVYGRDATATVTEARDGAGDATRLVRALRVNGKVVASTAAVDLRLQRLLGHVPGLLHGEVERALVIGLGTGMTAGALLDLPTLHELRVVEISEAVALAAREFDAWNGPLLDDPRTALEIADGRHALALAAPGSYDLITADPIHPWTRGSSDLYALEHFEAMARALAPGGVASQWLPLYQLSTEDVRTVVATWIAAFPEASAWLTAYDLVLVGSAAPLARQATWWRAPLPPRVAAGLAPCGLHGPLEVAALWVGDREDLALFSAGAEPMRLDRPVLEFRAPRSFLAGYSTEALAWAARPAAEGGLGGLGGLPNPARARGAEVAAALERFLAALPAGLSAAAAEYGAELLALPPLEQP